jgi:VCBS repeat-containing protein
MRPHKGKLARWFAARLAPGRVGRPCRSSRWRRPEVEALEDRLVPNGYSLTAVADGYATDKNLDGVFESLNTTGSAVNMELYPPVYNIGEERGLVQFNLSGIPANTTVTSARILGNIPSYTYQNSIPVNVSFFGYAGSGTLSTTDAANVSQPVGTLSNVTLGQFATAIDTSFLQGLISAGQHYVGFTMTVPSGTSVQMDSLETSPPSPQVLTLQVNYDQNHAPVAVNDSYSVNENGSLSVPAPGFMANDSDADGDPLKAVLVSSPSHSSSFGFSVNGGFSYKPANYFYGTDSFSYKLFDGFTYSNVATVTLNVNGSDTAPVAQNDAYTTPTNTALNVSAPGVLGNDSDVNNDPLTAVLVTNPGHGSLTLNSNGSFAYTPAAGYHGTDTFTYEANDGTLNSSPATVAITVNDPPTANADGYAVTENTALTVSAPGVLANDTDPNGDALTAALYSAPAHGTLTFNANGSFTYTPGTNFTGTDSFVYRDSDGYSYGNLATVTLAVNAVNQPPVAKNDSYITPQNATLTVAAPGVLANDSDAENEPLSASLVGGPSHGSLTLNANGSLTYVPVAGYNGSDSFTYQVSDPTSSGGTATVTIKVDAPPSAAADSYSTNENTTLTVAAPGVLGNDTDPDGDTLTASIVASPQHGSVVLNSNGSFSYYPNTYFYGSDSFTYQAFDGLLYSNTATVTLTVNHVNQPPTGNQDGYVATEDTPLTIAAPGVLGNDTDPDNDPLTAVLSSAPANGTVALNADGSFTYTPNKDFAGTDRFYYKASDGQLLSAATPVLITVKQVNDAPVANNDSYSVNENGTLTIAAAGAGVSSLVMTSQSGDYIGGGQSYNYTTATGTFTGYGNSQSGVEISYIEPGYTNWWYLNFATPYNQVLRPGTYLSATRYPFEDLGVPGLDVDGDGRGSNTLTGQFTVLQALYDTTGKVLSFDATFVQHSEGATPALSGEIKYNAFTPPAGVLANDTDAEANALTAALVSGPAHGTLTLNPDGTFTYAPNPYFYGTDSFTYRASDGLLSSNTGTVTINVAKVNHAPTATADSYGTYQDKPLTVTAPGVLANDTDPEGDPLTAVLSSAPANGTVALNADGSFTYTPNKGFTGTDRFYYTASDGQLSSASTPVVITVTPVTWTDLGRAGTTLVAGTTSGGTQELFTIGKDHSLYEAEQNPDGSWGAWNSLGGGCAGPLAVAENSSGYLHAYVIGQDGQTWFRDQTGPGAFAGWGGLGGACAALAAGTNADGSEQVFVVGADGALYTNLQTGNGGWTGWQSLGGGCKPVVAVARDASGYLDAYVIGQDGQLWYRDQTGRDGFAGWARLGGYCKSLAAGNNADGTTALYVVGAGDSALYCDEQYAGGGWTGWQNLGGGCAGPLAAARDSEGYLTPFVIGGDGQVYYRTQTARGAFNGWGGLGGSASALAAVTNIDGTDAVFASWLNTNELWRYSPLSL